jgi:hypothetical protein
VVPWDVHSQYPPTGIEVEQFNLSPRHVFARTCPPANIMAVTRAAAKKREELIHGTFHFLRK